MNVSIIFSYVLRRVSVLYADLSETKLLVSYKKQFLVKRSPKNTNIAQTTVATSFIASQREHDGVVHLTASKHNYHRYVRTYAYG